jgi:hypothetical protein
MNKVFASVLVLGIAGVVAGCGKVGLPGGECKFNKGEIAEAQGEAKAFLEAALDVKKSVDQLEAEWSAEIKALAGELQVEQASEDAVLAKISANVSELKAKGECTVAFDAKVSASASGSASGSAATGEGAAGSAAGGAAAAVTVDFDVKCKAEASVKGTLDVTTAAVKGHFPKLLAISASFKEIVPKVTEVAGKAEGAISATTSNPLLLGEVKCAAEAVTGIKASAEVKMEFSVKAEASAKGEAKAG